MLVQVKYRPRHCRPTDLAESQFVSSTDDENRRTESGSEATIPCNIALLSSLHSLECHLLLGGAVVRASDL